VNCEETRRTMDNSGPEDLPEWQQEAVCEHLAECTDCLIYVMLGAFGPATKVQVSTVAEAAEVAKNGCNMVGLTPVRHNPSLPQMLPEVFQTPCDMCGQQCWAPPKAKPLLGSGAKVCCADCRKNVVGVDLLVEEHVRDIKAMHSRHRSN